VLRYNKSQQDSVHRLLQPAPPRFQAQAAQINQRRPHTPARSALFRKPYRPSTKVCVTGLQLACLTPNNMISSSNLVKTTGMRSARPGGQSPGAAPRRQTHAAAPQTRPPAACCAASRRTRRTTAAGGPTTPVGGRAHQLSRRHIELDPVSSGNSGRCRLSCGWLVRH